jgi:heme/copper-type cytochrome/quinol oxidase subunit 4
LYIQKKKKKKNAKTTKYIVTFIPSILLVPFTLPIAHVAIYPAKTYSLVYTTQKNAKTTKYVVIFIPSIPLVPFTLPIFHVAIYPAKHIHLSIHSKKCQNNKNT